MKHFFKKSQNEKGYTLLFAVLIASLTLAVGISILNISRKEFLIATSTRDSTLALYAADGGLECALFADEKGFFEPDKYNGTLPCNLPHNTVSWNLSNLPTGGTQNSYTFHAKLHAQSGPDDVGGSCAVIIVTKTLKENQLTTVIQSLGYNTGWSAANGNCSLGSAKRVERALQYTVS